MPLTREEADALWKEAAKQQQDRADYMPSVDAALTLLTQAHQRLKELGWREAMYCPKDGTVFEIIEAGSSGIHRCHYDGEWPNGWWVHADGDLCPSHPILWRPCSPATTHEKQS
jgi:hypothetical protein